MFNECNRVALKISDWWE